MKQVCDVGVLVLQRKRTCDSEDSERVSRQGLASRGWQAGFSSIWHGRKERFIHESNCQPGDWIQVGNDILSNIGSAGKPVQEKVSVPSEGECEALLCPG